ARGLGKQVNPQGTADAHLALQPVRQHAAQRTARSIPVNQARAQEQNRQRDEDAADPPRVPRYTIEKIHFFARRSADSRDGRTLAVAASGSSRNRPISPGMASHSDVVNAWAPRASKSAIVQTG